MKGVMFTEFLELVETKFGLEAVDYIIEKSNLKSNGIYTAIGSYEFTEMLALVTNLSEYTQTPINEILRTYGRHFFEASKDHYSTGLSAEPNAIKFITKMEGLVSLDHKKLYPDEHELPNIEILEETETKLIMIYRSPRRLYPFLHGAMEKIFDFYEEKADINYELIKEDGTEVRFEIYKQ